MTTMCNDELVAKIIRISTIISTELNPLENRSLIFLIEDFDKQRIRHSEFRKSIQLLFEKKQRQEDEKTQQDRLLLSRDAKIYRTDESNRVAVRVKVDENSKERHDERESEKYVANVFNFEGKKRRILQPKPINERPLKKTRTSKRLERVTPSYKLIPEEEQCPVSDTVLNNKCYLIEVDGASGHKKLTRYQEAMTICEDEMFETDLEIGSLRSAVDNAEKVIEGEMKMEDLGVKFYRCIEKLCCRDMLETVRQDNKQGLPVILSLLKQKLNNLTVAREKLKSGWKHVLEENTGKQRESTAKSHRKKLKAKQKIRIRF